MRKIFVLDSLITPRFMTAIHIILQLCVLMIFIGGSITAFRFGSVSGFFSTLIVCVLSAIAARVACEVLLVIFRIYDVLRDLRRHGIRLQEPDNPNARNA